MNQKIKSWAFVSATWGVDGLRSLIKQLLQRFVLHNLSVLYSYQKRAFAVASFACAGGPSWSILVHPFNSFHRLMSKSARFLWLNKMIDGDSDRRWVETSKTEHDKAVFEIRDSLLKVLREKRLVGLCWFYLADGVCIARYWILHVAYCRCGVGKHNHNLCIYVILCVVQTVGCCIPKVGLKREGFCIADVALGFLSQMGDDESLEAKS